MRFAVPAAMDAPEPAQELSGSKTQPPVSRIPFANVEVELLDTSSRPSMLSLPPTSVEDAMEKNWPGEEVPNPMRVFVVSKERRGTVVRFVDVAMENALTVVV